MDFLISGDICILRVSGFRGFQVCSSIMAFWSFSIATLEISRIFWRESHDSINFLVNFARHKLRARERSGEGVVRRKQLSKRVFLESPFLLCPLKVCSYNTWKVLENLRGQRRNGLSKNTLLDNRFSAWRLRRSFGTPPIIGRPLKTTFDMTTLIFSSGGCPSCPFYPLKRVPSYPFLAENPSSEGATKDHLSSKPPQGEPPGTKKSKWTLAKYVK